MDNFVNNTIWEPIIGAETRALLQHLNLPNESQSTLVDETKAILSKCGNPINPTNNEIGLAFGYVQSGKTMSFTTLTAMAKDNGYQIIIIIAGISTNLVEQSFTRLEKDLRIDTRDDLQWLSIKNPRIENITMREQVSNTLNEWRDLTFPVEDRRTVLITVMKQRNHIPNLQRMLSTLNLENVPTLIIDDEADQHSMDTRARQNARTSGGTVSPMHGHIVELKNSIPHHTFIQYTATPQGPLFIDILNSLSPNFIELLTPGPGYTGGRVFFIERPELIQVIDDIDPEIDPTVPPQSLIEALQIFFLGVAKGLRFREGKKRSMMIHPSQFTYTHTDYFRFVSNIRQNFVEILSLPDNNPDKIDLIQEFRSAYNSLSSTTNDLPPFEELTGNNLRHCINSTVVQSLNSQRGNRTNVDWRNNYSFILIGGQAMDRGFTVEGLTVTYMPRSIGVGNADTIQQRARFFGYKQNYLGYCRVYLDSEARDVYVRYVEHEENMRYRLRENIESGLPLNEWPREVYLAGDMNLARGSIFSHEFERTTLDGEWLTIKSPHNSHNVILRNQTVVNSFIENSTFDTSGRFPRFEGRLANIYDELLNQLQFTSSNDIENYNSLLYSLDNYLANEPDENCTIYLMSDFNNPRERTLNERNEINQLFQGRSTNYDGDREIKSAGITIQIHILNLLNNDTIAYREVVAIASYISTPIGREIIRWA